MSKADPEMVESLHKSMDFLLKEFPKIQRLMEKFSADAIASNDRLGLEQSLTYHKQLSTFYTTSLELIRKITIFFPKEITPEESDFLNKYRRLSTEEKSVVQSVIRGSLNKIKVEW